MKVSNFRRTAFTLIELLIVVAILAILSAGTMALITAPMTEAARATTAQVRLAGETALFQSLVSDAHRSGRAAVAPGSGAQPFDLFPGQDETGTIRYSISTQGLVVRTAPGDPTRTFDLGRLVERLVLRSAETTPTQNLRATVEVIFAATRPQLPAMSPAVVAGPDTLQFTIALRAGVFGR